MRYLVFRVIVATLCCTVLIACGKTAPTPAPSAERAGIITLAPHLTETVFALGQGNRVIAVGSFCDYPPEANDLPRVGGYIDPDLERITILRPSLLILPGKHEEVAAYAKIENIPVLNVHMDSLETIDEGIRTIADALGCPERGDALRAEIKQGLDKVQAAVAGRPRPKVLIITGRGEHDLNSLFTVGGGSFVSEVVELAGGDNIFRDTSEAYFEASKETVVMKAPEVILEFHAGERLSDAEKAAYIADWKGLPSLPAVGTDRIYIITEASALRPGPRVTEIAREIAGLLHPESGPF